MAPELLNPAKFGKETRRPTQPGDIHAFGTTVYDVINGTRPTKPGDAESIGFGGGTWELVEECWMGESTERPKAKDVLARLSSVVAFSAVVGPTILKTPLKMGGGYSETQ